MIRRTRREPARPHRVLVAGWFSFPALGATAGDLLALEVTRTWLSKVGMPFDVALEGLHGQGVDWRRVDPEAYSHLLFVCGPFYARRRLLRVLPRRLATAVVRTACLAGPIGIRCIERIVLELLVRRFDRCRMIGLNLSMLGPRDAWHPFDALVQRDGGQGSRRADIALAHRGEAVPVVGLVLVEHGSGNDEERQVAAERTIQEVLRPRSLAIVRIDTRLDRPNPGGLRTPAEVESLIARMDVVVTTRLHGAVLALKHGVPVVAVDLVRGGGKVTSQMSVLGWPHVFDAVTDASSLGRALDSCLGPGSREAARDAGRRGIALAEAVGLELLAALRDEAPNQPVGVARPREGARVPLVGHDRPAWWPVPRRRRHDEQRDED